MALGSKSNSLGSSSGGAPNVNILARPGAAGNVHEPAANTAAVVTLAGVGAQRHNVTAVFWSYDAIPTAGSLTITDAGATVLKVDIPNEGVGFLPFKPPLQSTAVNTDMVATLAGGGAGISGIVSLHAWTEA